MSSPDHGPSAPDKLYDFPERRNLPLPFLNPEAIELLRKKQAELIHEAQKDIDPMTDRAAYDQAEQDAYAQFGSLAEQYLEDFGVDRARDPNWHRYLDILSENSVNNMGDDEWLVGRSAAPDGSGGTVSGRDRAMNSYNDLLQGMNDEYEAAIHAVPDPEPILPPEPEPEDPDKDKKKTPEEIKNTVDANPAVQAARQNVDNLRSRLAKLSAKRQGRLFNREGGKLQEEYDEVEAQYKKAIALLTRIELDAEKTAGRELSEDDERTEAAFRVVKQFHDLQAEAVETLKNTKVGKMITWLTTGGTVKRLAKGLLVGGAVGAVGAAITTFTLGTAGGAVGAGLAFAGTRAAAFARGFAAYDNKEGRGMGIVDIDDNDPNSAFSLKTMKESGAEGKSRDEAVDLVHRHLMARLENDTKVEQGKRRKSTFKALGVVAIGATLAEGINLGVNAFTGHIKGAHSLIAGNPDVHAQSAAGPTPPVEVPKPSVSETVYSPNALNIKAGEGWYQTFKDMGIPKDQWHDLLGKVGPQLHDVQVDGHPLAYRMPNGDWGIRMTPDGHMPKSALDLISHAHDQMNGTPTSTGAGIETSTGSTPSGLSVAEAAQNVTPDAPASVDTLAAPADRGGIQNIIHRQVIQPSDIESNPNFNTFTHVRGMTPEMMGQHLGLRATEWDQLQDYIAHQVTIEHNTLYSNVFTVNPDGYLRFTTTDIPPATMADILNNGIPAGVRARL
ncbi:MAG TPA: hypothetical protein VFH06_00060 [Candidatus Saccharimonadales bacterium]|nr:hypothetical protein [Candidatus Saccharimonadales bacterium]